MHTFLHFLQQDWIHSLGWTLLHSLWQHALIAISCALALAFTRHVSSNTRYLIALVSLVLSALISAITFYQYQQASTQIILRPAQKTNAMESFADENLSNAVQLINGHINSFVVIWLVGFLVYSLKTLLEYRYCQQLKNSHIIATPEQWQTIFTTLVDKVGARTDVTLRISTLATSPCVIGHFKPVVLLPLAVLMGMNQQQIEMILLHEIAHVRRNDYLLGFLQTTIKILFFFNPFLRWISNQIDKEREHACDDIAVAISKNPILFANTLKEFATMQLNQKAAMNITGNKLLLNRITRLFDTSARTTKSNYSLLASVLILFSGLIITLCANANPTIDKKISLNVADMTVQEVLLEVNKKCDSNETLTANANEKITLVLEDISCQQAIGLLKDFAEGAAGAETSNLQ